MPQRSGFVTNFIPQRGGWPRSGNAAAGWCNESDTTSRRSDSASARHCITGPQENVERVGMTLLTDDTQREADGDGGPGWAVQIMLCHVMHARRKGV